MKASKLYQALVMGGALLVSGGCQEAPKRNVIKPETAAPTKAVSEPKAEGEKQQMFCGPNNKKTCQNGAPLPGIECCWNTNC